MANVISWYIQRWLSLSVGIFKDDYCYQLVYSKMAIVISWYIRLHSITAGNCGMSSVPPSESKIIHTTITSFNHMPIVSSKYAKHM